MLELASRFIRAELTNQSKLDVQGVGKTRRAQILRVALRKGTSPGDRQAKGTTGMIGQKRTWAPPEKYQDGRGRGSKKWQVSGYILKESQHDFMMGGICSMRERGERMTCWVFDPSNKKSGADISWKENCRSSRFRSEDKEFRHVKSEMPIKHPSSNGETLSLLSWSRNKYAVYRREGHYL